MAFLKEILLNSCDGSAYMVMAIGFNPDWISNAWHARMDEIELMQWTGWTEHALSEKDGGREIWEGDIYEVTYGDGESELGVIKRLLNGQWIWDSLDSYQNIEDFAHSDMGYKGTIYENPELLEKIK